MMKPFFSICMCLCAPYLIDAQQLSEQELSALVDIEQAVYQAQSTETRDSLLFIKASLYKDAGAFELSLSTLDRISYSAGIKNDVKIINEKISLNYMLGNYTLVKSLILETAFVEGYKKTREIEVLEVLNAIALRDLDEAEKAFEQLNVNAVSIEELFDVKKFKDPEKAFKLSFMLPGLGQIYTGKWFKGVTSLTIQAGLFYTGLNGIRRKYFFTEALPAIALFQGFYFGGAEYARELAENRNKEIVKNLSLSTLSVIKKEASD